LAVTLFVQVGVPIITQRDFVPAEHDLKLGAASNDCGGLVQTDLYVAGLPGQVPNMSGSNRSQILLSGKGGADGGDELKIGCVKRSCTV